MRIFCQMVSVAILISSELLNMVAMLALHLVLQYWFTHFRFNTMWTEMSNHTLFTWQPLSILLLQ